MYESKIKNNKVIINYQSVFGFFILLSKNSEW